MSDNKVTDFQNDSTAGGRRKTYFDVLRLIAIFFVLYAHTDRLAVHHYFIEGSQSSYWLALFLQQVTYINTTLFFVISGALLLPREESFKDILRKRVLKYVIIIIVFDFVQYCYNYYNNPEIGFDIRIIFKRMYATNMITQYWFLYAYLVFLLILPFIRILVKNMTDMLFRYLIIGFIVVNGLLPLIEVLWENDRLVLEIPLFANILIYPILGYYIQYKWYQVHAKGIRILLLNVAAFAGLALNVWYTYARMEEQAYYLAAEGLTVILVMVIYADVRYLCELISSGRVKTGKTENGIFSKVLAVAGKGTLVVYLLEPELREGFQFIYDNLYLKISWLPATILWLGCSIITGIAISFIYECLKKLVILLFMKFMKKSKKE